MSRSSAIITTAFLLLSTAAFAQQPAAGAREGREGRQGGAAGARREGGPARRPPLFFKEEWKQNEKSDEHDATQESVANPNLELNVYGPSHKVELTGKAGDENNPIHVWTGLCESPCAVTLRDKNNMADLTGLARIRWTTKMSGFHKVHPLIKLADGTYLVGDREEGSTTDWLVSEFNLSDMKWLKLDPKRVVTTGNYVNNVDLSKVDEIGFADLLPSSGHGPGGWADVAQIEVFAKPVARSGATQ